MIPKALRDEVGLQPGPVELTADGSGLRLEAVAREDVGESAHGRLVIPWAGGMVDDEMVWALRHADQR